MFAAILLVCEVDGSAGVGFGGGVVAVSAYISGTRDSDVLASACDVLEISVVRGVGGVYDICMCLAWGGVAGVGGEWVTGLGLGFTNSEGTWGKWDMCLCFGCGCVGGVGESRWAAWANVWEGGVVLCLCVLLVWILYVDGRSRYLYIVLGGFLLILGAPSVQSCCTLSIFAS